MIHKWGVESGVVGHAPSKDSVQSEVEHVGKAKTGDVYSGVGQAHHLVFPSRTLGG